MPCCIGGHLTVPYEQKTQPSPGSDFNTALLHDMMEKEFKDKDVIFEIKPWLDNWFKVLLKRGWHAPVIMVNGKVFAQGKIIKRKPFTEYVNSLL